MINRFIISQRKSSRPLPTEGVQTVRQFHLFKRRWRAHIKLIWFFFTTEHIYQRCTGMQKSGCSTGLYFRLNSEEGMKKGKWLASGALIKRSDAGLVGSNFRTADRDKNQERKKIGRKKKKKKRKWKNSCKSLRRRAREAQNKSEWRWNKEIVVGDENVDEAERSRSSSRKGRGLIRRSSPWLAVYRPNLK